MTIKKRIKLLLVFGTRPELIKLIPVIRLLEIDQRYDLVVCNTSQHKELLSGIIQDYSVKINHDLDVMRENQSLSGITNSVLSGISHLIGEVNPDFIIVHGDTTTAYASSLAAFYMNTRVLHIEAGLRTHDRFSPFPEEFNRTSISLMSFFHFAPTKNAYNNLINFGIEPSQILVTGNTVIDLVKLSFDSNFECDELTWVGQQKFILFTAHRRENLDHMEEMFRAIRDVMIEFSYIKMVYPIHKNPKVKKIAYKYFLDLDNVLMIEALDVRSFHNLMARSYFVVSDSGGVQEEAPTFGVPVVLMRTSTERPEGLDKGIILSGVTYSGIQETVMKLLKDKEFYQKSKPKFNPFGDGNASNRIIDALNRISESLES